MILRLRDAFFARGYHRIFVRAYCVVWGVGLGYAIIIKPIIACVRILAG